VTTHPAHDRIAKANDIAHGERVRQQIAALEACLVDRPMPKHPAPGCPCHGCDGRDRATGGAA
jgi:hypothetical protein